MAAIVSLAEVKAFAGVTSVNADAVLQSLIDVTPVAFASYCNRDSFFKKTHTVFRDGTGSAKMVMVNAPMRDVSSVAIDGMVIPKAGTYGGVGFSWTPGGRVIFLNGYRFTSGIKNCVITYEAGYDDPGVAGSYPFPVDLIFAAKMYVTLRYREKDRLGVASKSLAGESVSYSDSSGGGGSSTGGVSGMPPAAANILENYMNYVPESNGI